MLDAVRFDCTGLYSSKNSNTPFLTELLRENKIFNFIFTYSTHDSSNSSHFSLLTGFLTGWQSLLALPQHSLPYQLRALGYKTFGISANGNLSPTTTSCFVPFDNFVNLYEIWTALSEEEKNYITLALDKRISLYGGKINDFNRTCVFCSGNKVIALFKDYLKDAKLPFFCFLNLFDAHDPYFPETKYYDLKKKRFLLTKKLEEI